MNAAPFAFDRITAVAPVGRCGGRARHPTGVPLRRPMHPGCFLQRQVLTPLALTQTEVAQVLGISRRRVNELVHGQRAMSPDTAIRCALAFGLDVDHLLGLQARWDSHHQWLQMRSAASLSVSAPAVRRSTPENRNRWPGVGLG